MYNWEKYTKWQFPGQIHKFNGLLNIDSNNKGTLTLRGDINLDFEFSEYKGSLKENPSNDYLFILGETKDTSNKEIITILGFENGGCINDFVEKQFIVRNYFIGHHFSNYEQLKFDDVTVEYSNFDTWMNTHDFGNFDMNGLFKYGWKDQNYLLDFSLKKMIEIQINMADKVQIFKLPKVEDNLLIKPRWNRHVYVKFISKRKDYDYFIERIHQFKDFLNFFITKFDVHILNVYATLNISVENSSLMKKVKIIIGYQYPFKTDFKKLKVITPFLIQSLEENRFKELIIKWFGIRTTYLSAYDLFFDSMYNGYLYLQNQYLMLFSALEIYTDIKLKEDKDNKLNEKIKRIENLGKVLDEDPNISNADREWLKSMIENKKSFSEKERLTMIYNRYNELLSKLSTNIGDTNKFSKTNKDIRNLLIHGHIDYNDYDVEELFWNNKNIQLILYLCILTELGYSIEDLKKIFMLK